MAAVATESAKHGPGSLLERWKRLDISLRSDSAGNGRGPEQAEQIKAALEVLEKAWERFSPEQISFAFNGGKDSTVLLYLLLVFLEQRFETEDKAHAALSRLRLCYFDGKDEFPQVTAFMESCVARYSLNITKLPADYKKGLGMLEADGIKAVLMGQRSTDPAGKGLEHFTPCTQGWPNIVRVNPLLNWSYSTVWAWLRGLNAPYCELYDEGYSSLGSVSTTTKNPHLGDKPAYELSDGDAHERVSRTNTPTSASKKD